MPPPQAIPATPAQAPSQSADGWLPRTNEQWTELAATNDPASSWGDDLFVQRFPDSKDTVLSPSLLVQPPNNLSPRTPPANPAKNLIDGLNAIPERYRDTVYALLDSPAFIALMRTDGFRQTLQLVGSGQTRGLAELAAALPDSALRDDLLSLKEIVDDPKGWKSRLVGLILSPGDLAANVENLARTMYALLSGYSEDSRLALLVLSVVDQGHIKAGSLLRAVENGDIPLAPLNRVMLGKAQPGDVLTLLRCARQANGGELALPVHDLVLEVIRAKPELWAALWQLQDVETARFDGADDLSFTFASSPKNPLPLGLEAGETITFHLEAMDRGGIRARSALAVMKVVDRFYDRLAEPFTGFALLDWLISFLLIICCSFLFPLVVLVIAMGVPDARVEWKRDGDLTTTINLYGLPVATVAKA